MADEIIEELWRIKDEIARENDYDIDRVIQSLKTSGVRKDHPRVDLAALKAARAKSESQKKSEEAQSQME